MPKTHMIIEFNYRYYQLYCPTSFNTITIVIITICYIHSDPYQICFSGKKTCIFLLVFVSIFTTLNPFIQKLKFIHTFHVVIIMDIWKWIEKVETTMRLSLRMLIDANQILEMKFKHSMNLFQNPKKFKHSMNLLLRY